VVKPGAMSKFEGQLPIDDNRDVPPLAEELHHLFARPRQLRLFPSCVRARLADFSQFGTSLEQLGRRKTRSRYGLAQPLQRVSSLAGTPEYELAKQVLCQLSYTPSAFGLQAGTEVFMLQRLVDRRNWFSCSMSSSVAANLDRGSSNGLAQRVRQSCP
jgi:hypothetical protein